MSEGNNGIFGEEPNALTVKELLSKYLSYWPVFLVGVILCVGAAILYIQFTPSKYLATTYILIKGTEGGSAASDDILEAALNGKREVNLNNEMLLLAAANLMESTVARNGFYVSYFKKGPIVNTEVYKDAPFTLNARQLTDSSRTYVLDIEKLTMAGGTILCTSSNKERLTTFRWNEPFDVDGEDFILAPKRLIKNEDGEYLVRWQPVEKAAAELSEALQVKAYDPKTTVIQLSIKTENLQRGKDVLNALFSEFMLSDKEDQHKLAKSTVQFIDDRLLSISGELKGVESNLESYQGKNQLVDIKGQSAQWLENSNEGSQNMKNLAIQQSVAAMIMQYFTNPANGNKLVPSSLGLNDPTLAMLITQYNELQLKRERETPLVAPNSTVMQDLNTQLASLKSSMLESLGNINKNLQLQERNLRQQNSRTQSFLSAVPHNERVLQEIRRKQNITEGLYLYLLQKREEAAISSSAFHVSHYRQIDQAIGYGPVEPNTRNLLVYSALLGLFLGFAWTYTRNLLSDKIMTKDDITRRTSLSLLGQISHHREQDKFPVLERTVIGEEFRVARTSLLLLLKDTDKKTILVTSSITGEGKSFTSMNLAAVLAMPDKKAALLEFDLRQPSIVPALNVANSKGITNYLNGDIACIFDIKRSSSEIPGLHIYPSGPMPANPADLLLSENMSRLFETLKAEYDYIIVDSPPAGLVSDPLILGEFCDMVLYVTRHNKTTRKHLDLVNKYAADGSLKNINIVLNDVRSNNSHHNHYFSGYDKPGGIKGRKRLPF